MVYVNCKLVRIFGIDNIKPRGNMNNRRISTCLSLFRAVGLLVACDISLALTQGVDSTWLGQTVRIETGQNITHTGTLLGFDDTEYLIETSIQGNVTVPKYMVVSIERLDPDHPTPDAGSNFRPARNFFTATAFPVQRGVFECSLYYIAAGNLDAGLTDRLTLSVSTAWLVATAIGVKYALVRGPGVSLAVTGTVGSTPFSGFSGEYSGAAGRGVLTFGRPDHYLSISGGYFTNFGKDQWIDYGWYGGGYWERNHYSAAFAGISGYTQVSPRVGILGEVNIGFDDSGSLGFGVAGARLNNKRRSFALDLGVGSPVIPGESMPVMFLPYLGAMFRL